MRRQFHFESVGLTDLEPPVATYRRGEGEREREGERQKGGRGRREKGMERRRRLKKEERREERT